MRKTITLIALLLVSWITPSLALAQRPTAPKLFPQKTLFYARVDDTRDLKDKMSQTAAGKMGEDPQIKPILASFYTQFISLADGLRDQVGLSLEELLAIPNGELAIALVPTKDEPVFCALLEAGDELPAVELLMDRFEKQVLSNGAQKKTKEVGKISLHQFSHGPELAYFVDSGVLVFCSNPEYGETLAQTWQGSGIDHKPLSENREFLTIMGHCVGTEGERPQISFYGNPIALFREFSKKEAMSLTALATMKALGVDGIKGFGGSVIMAPNDFDSIMHGHLLMDNNRKGVLRAIRPKSGSTEPEGWVDDKVVSYNTMNWDFEKTIKAIAEIVDSFAGENAFENNVIANGSKELGIDLRKDFLELLSGRVSMSQLVLLPKRINSQSNLFAFHLNDSKKMSTEVLPKFFEKIKAREKRWNSTLYGDSTIYWLDIRNDNQNLRMQLPAFAVVDDCLMMSDSKESIEQAVSVLSSGEDLLSDSLEYKLVRDRIKAQLKDKETSIMQYQRPDESLRLFYDLAKDPANIDRLESISENNPFFTALVNALRSKDLPPFEVIAKYLAPSGAFMVEEEDGLHYTTFSLRRE